MSSWGTTDQVSDSRYGSKLWMLNEIYHRPTASQALVEVIKDYVRNAESLSRNQGEKGAPKHTVEALVIIARREVEAERRDAEST